jgi:hypothetical protein
MSISIGIGIKMGRRIVGYTPSTEVTAPPVTLLGTAGISIVGLEALSPADFLTAVPGSQILSLGGIGITLTGAGLAGWQDLSGNARHWANGGAEAVCGVYTAADSTIINRGSVLFDGVNDFLPNVWNPPAPGTTPTWMRIIAKQVSRVSSGQLICGNLSNRYGVRSGTATALVNAGNTTNTAGIEMTLGQWFAVDVFFNNAVADYLHIGATKLTGVALGSADPAALCLGARSLGDAVFGNFAVAGVHLANAEPAGRLTTVNDLYRKWFGAGVTLPS